MIAENCKGFERDCDCGGVVVGSDRKGYRIVVRREKERCRRLSTTYMEEIRIRVRVSTIGWKVRGYEARKRP